MSSALKFYDEVPQTFPIVETDEGPMIEAYNHYWPLQNDIALHLNAFRIGLSKEVGGLGKVRHLFEAHNLIWPNYAATLHEWTIKRFKAFCAGHKVITLAGGASSAKAQPLDCVVRTPTEWKKIKDCKIGNVICVPNGEISTITAIHYVGKKKTYKITFFDGTSTEAAEDHLWNIRNNRDAEHNRPWKTQTTLETKKHLRRGKVLNQRIPITEPVAGISSSLPLPPYVLGYLLGNGNFSQKRTVRISVPEKETVEFLSHIYPCRLQKNGEKRNGCYTLTPLKIYNVLNQLGLRATPSHLKHIPRQYLFAAPEDRLELLRGLMDSDGSVSQNGASFSTASPQLAQDFQDLCEGLGILCKFSRKKAGYKKDGKYIPCKDSYQCFLKVPKGLNPFHLSTKANKYKPTGRFHVKKIQSIEYIGEKDCACIVIDHPDQLYLTNNYIVTHNSADAARYALLWWWALPEERTVIVASTTIGALMKRIWSYVTSDLYKAKGNMPGIVSNSPPPKIRLRKEETKHGIYGVALKEGNPDRTIAEIIGIHPEEGLLVVVDEATDVTAAFLDAIPNWDKGGHSFQLIVIGNSKSKLDPHGKLSEPIGGWSTVDPDIDEEWKTKMGICLYFDCYKSPAILSPDKDRLKFLITQEKIVEDEIRLGKNDPKFWRFTRGFWPPEDLTKTVLTLSLVETHKVTEPAEWNGTWLVRLASLDPAFTADGDECILRFGTLGPGRDSVLVLDFGGPENIISLKLDAKSKEPINYQIVRLAKEECEKRGVLPEHFGVDTWGFGSGAGDIFEREWDTDIHRVIGIGAPSDRFVDSDMADRAYELYQDTTTEMWFAMRNFVQTGQIKGLDDETIEEFCSRQYEWKGRKIALEKKRDYKIRMGRGDGPTGSPDRADAAAILLEVAQRTGLMPGARTISNIERAGWERDWEITRGLKTEKENPSPDEITWNTDAILGSSMNFGGEDGEGLI